MTSSESPTNSARHSIAFVCTGNMCRSPFAEHLFRTFAVKGMQVKSAGLTALPGGKSSMRSIAAARAFGVDLSVHSTRPLDDEVISEVHAIYVFENFHRTNLERLFPAAASKIKLLGSVIDGMDREIPDPVSGSEERIIECYKEIQRACIALAAPEADKR